MSHTARIWTQGQLTEALASACVLEDVSILHLGQYSDTAIRNLKAVAQNHVRDQRHADHRGGRR